MLLTPRNASLLLILLTTTSYLEHFLLIPHITGNNYDLNLSQIPLSTIILILCANTHTPPPTITHLAHLGQRHSLPIFILHLYAIYIINATANTLNITPPLTPDPLNLLTTTTAILLSITASSLFNKITHRP